MRAVPLAICCLLVPASAPAGDATDLLFFSADLHRGEGYGGAGWMHAPSGLDADGLVFAAEIGRPYGGDPRAAALAGLRFVSGRVIATGLAGIEAGPEVRPVASADLWWDEAGLMASARVQASPAYVSARAAFGWRPLESWPWLGPEFGWADQAPRLGLHATGLRLPYGFEARTSAGWLPGGAYGEVSLWRRF